MKHLAFLTISLFAAAAFAQAPAKEAAKPEPTKEASKSEPAKAAEASKAAAVGPRIPNPRRWHEDARHCLERPTNTEVIKCAEEYL